MLKPSNDRLDYSNLLTPPAGYQTSFAVGTTYSLDLNTLIGISIALGLSESIDSQLKNNPIYLLEALKRTADKVMVFCEGGQIKAPASPSPLHILLEKMVTEVKLKNKKSFHPKFWLVKYENNEGDSLYRCIVLSRNLTFDRSWDVAVCIEGKYNTEGGQNNSNTKSKPIHDFLNALLKLAGKNDFTPDKRKLFKQLTTEIENVQFILNNQKIEDFEFCPVGISNYGSEVLDMFQTYHELFVISPFISNEIINQFNSLKLTNPQQNTLITRKSEIHKLKSSSTNNFDVYVLKDIIVDGEEVISEGEEESEDKSLQDIHAKVYCKTKYSNTELSLGSLNATSSAFYGNIEFMIKLYAKRRYINVEQLAKDLFGENVKENPFEKIEIIDGEPEEPESKDLEKVIKEICRLKSYAKVIENENNKYSIELTFEDLIENENIKISPLFSQKQIANITATVRFENLGILQLSEFYLVEVSDGDAVLRRIIKINTDNIPNQRESAIVNEIIKDKNGFIQYISFLLGDDYLLAFLENNQQLKENILFGTGDTIPAIYEKMLKTAANSPQKLQDIKKLMDLITSEEIIPEDFKEIYDVFEKAVRK